VLEGTSLHSKRRSWNWLSTPDGWLNYFRNDGSQTPELVLNVDRYIHGKTTLIRKFTAELPTSKFLTLYPAFPA
jgi:small ligand-binding sensory domain FIST